MAQPPERSRMATRKSRTDGAAGRTAPDGTAAPAEEKPKKKKPATKAKAKPAVKAAPGEATPERAEAAPKRRGRFASARPLAPEPEIDEAEIEASLGDKASGKNLVVVESPTKS